MKSKIKKDVSGNPFLALTWLDFQEWAGSKILSRGKSYQRSGQVEDMGITGNNEIVAWVEGSVRYATRVSFKRGKLSSTCTCPYGTDCKHGVATVIEYLESVKKNKEIPVVQKNDKRLALIKQGKTTWPDESNDDDWEEELEEEENDEDDDTSPDESDSIAGFLKGKSSAELSAILVEIAENHPEIQSELEFKTRMFSPSGSALVKTISREIDKASDEPGWHNHWEHSGFTPDYSRVKAGLKKLYDSGDFDEIVKLGKKLYAKGMEQTGQSDDEGETAQEITDALEIVFKALKQCSLPDVDKMEQAIDWELADEYGLSEGIDNFWLKRFDKKDWSAIADRLFNRLKGMKPESEDSEKPRNYDRDKLTNKILKAFESSGRSAEMIPLCMEEAPLTQSYERLVKLLREADRNDEAEAWIRKGIEDSEDQYHGIASELRNHLFEIRNAKRDWPYSAAIKADEFFILPSISEYIELKKACEKAKLWDKIHPSIITFLKTGKQPKPNSANWPLPETGIKTPDRNRYSSPPFTTVLIDIALHEKDIDEALRIYDADQSTRKGNSAWGFGWSEGTSEKIAEAVKERYPERAIAIWKQIAESHISRTSPKEYSIALGYLNRIQKVVKATGKEKHWRNYVAEIRAQNLRKIRLVEMLDSLSGRPIIAE
jgi:uncharacterized Zn finger protein